MPDLSGYHLLRLEDVNPVNDDHESPRNAQMADKEAVTTEPAPREVACTELESSGNAMTESIQALESPDNSGHKPCAGSEDDACPVSQYIQSREPEFEDAAEQQQEADGASAKEPLVEMTKAQEQASELPAGSNILMWWLPELVATALSLIAFACMCALLSFYDGQAASALHLPGSLTLNGLLALISTINKGCLTAPVASATMQEMWLYFAHEAGRTACKSQLRDVELYVNAANGVMGSILFVLRVRRTRFIACLACLITILSLGYSAFTQQLLALEVAPQNSLINIPRSETWDQYTGVWKEGNLFPSLDMVGAIYSGALGVKISPLEAECPSGNCTWPTTPSMAICGECVPSTFTTVDCTDAGDGRCTYEMPSGDRVNLTDPNNLAVLSNDSEWNSIKAFVALPFDRFYHPNNSKRAQDDDVDLKDIRLSVGDWYMFGAPFGARRNEILHYQNTDCSLWMCVNAYNRTVTNGKQEETLVASFDRFVDSDGSTAQLEPPRDSFWHLRSSMSAFDQGSVTDFASGTWAQLSLASYVESTMNGTVFIQQGGQTYRGNKDMMRGIWKGSADPTAWVNNLALSMTKIVRSSNSTERASYRGTQQVLTVHVRWEWLVLPASLVSASALVLAAVMIRTAHSPVPSWKGSPLMLLLFGLNNDLREAAVGQAQRRGGTDKAIGKRRVRFGRTDDGLWQFQEAASRDKDG